MTSFVTSSSDVGEYRPDYPDEELQPSLPLLEELNQPVHQTSYQPTCPPVVGYPQLNFPAQSTLDQNDFDNFLNYLTDDKCLDSIAFEKKNSTENVDVQNLPLRTRDLELGVKPANYDFSMSADPSVPLTPVIVEQTALITQPEDNYPIIEYDGKTLCPNDFNEEPCSKDDDLKKPIWNISFGTAPPNLADELIDSVKQDVNRVQTGSSQPVDDLADFPFEDLMALTKFKSQNGQHITDSDLPLDKPPKTPVSTTTDKFEQFSISNTEEQHPDILTANHRLGQKRQRDPSMERETQAKHQRSDPPDSYNSLIQQRQENARTEVRNYLNKKNISTFENVKKLGKDDVGKLVTLLMRLLYFADKGKTSKGVYTDRPANWPHGLFFGDPNNKQTGTGKKPSKPQILDMCQYLYNLWDVTKDVLY